MRIFLIKIKFMQNQGPLLLAKKQTIQFIFEEGHKAVPHAKFSERNPSFFYEISLYKSMNNLQPQVIGFVALEKMFVKFRTCICLNRYHVTPLSARGGGTFEQSF